MRANIFSATVISFLTLALTVLPVFAQENDPAKRQDIERLLGITNANELGDDMINQLINSFRQSNPEVPAEFWQNFQSTHSGNDFTQMLVEIYARHLTREEIQDIIAFYQSPTGEKFIASLPQIMQQSAEAGQQWGRGIGQELVEDLRQEGYLDNPATP